MITFVRLVKTAQLNKSMRNDYHMALLFYISGLLDLSFLLTLNKPINKISMLLLLQKQNKVEDNEHSFFAYSQMVCLSRLNYQSKKKENKNLS